MSKDFRYKSASCYVRKNGPQTYMLLSLIAETPGCGQGKVLISIVKKWAKHNNYNIVLYVSPFSHRFLEEKALFRWYSQRGFVYIGTQGSNLAYMEYRPRGWLAASQSDAA